MDVREQFAAIRGLIESARSMPMSASAVVNRAELIGMLDDLRDSMEAALRESSAVVADRDGVVDSAREQAELIVRDAERQRDQLVSDTDVFRLARHQAQDLLEKTQAECDALRAETDEYVDGRLANFEISLERTLESVKRGRDRLSGSVLASLTPEEADKIVLPEHLED
ncbi:MAG: hypothetical protein HZY75_08015 [Nocardioidaceae bacterium]|nr:MAG: hypothetical protein HZY75_08015 [Nocardioidaceae bacterium]